MLHAPVLGAQTANASAIGQSGSAFQKGKDLFLSRQYSAAIPFLQTAVLETEEVEQAWLCLGLSYQQMGNFDDAMSAFKKGMAKAATLKPAFLFNIGNLLVLQGKLAFAADSYTQSIEANPSYPNPWLGRANLRVTSKEYPAALVDYQTYLNLRPDTPQRPQIELMMQKLAQAITLQKDQAEKAQAELVAQEAARQELLGQLADSLKADSDSTTSLSAGTGDVQGYKDELKLDE